MSKGPRGLGKNSSFRNGRESFPGGLFGVMRMKNFVVLGDYDDSIHGWKYLKKVALKRGFFKSSVKIFMKGIVGKPAKLHCPL